MVPKRPNGHAAHVEDAVAARAVEYRPAAHKVQLLTLMATDRVEKVPAGHPWQEEEDGEANNVEYRPAPQF